MALNTDIGGTETDSYVTLAEYQAYGASLGWTLAGTDEADEVNLRRAFQSINRNWVYRGIVTDVDQVGAFPRYEPGSYATGVNPYVNGGNPYATRVTRRDELKSDEIPRKIKDAQCELAYLIQGGLDLFATIESSKTGEMIKIGPITIDEQTSPTGKARVVAVEGLLRPFLASGPGQIKLARG